MSAQKNISISLDTVNNLQTLTSKALAVIQLLSTDGQSIEGFKSRHVFIMDAIWLVNDLVDSIKNELRGI